MTAPRPVIPPTAAGEELRELLARPILGLHGGWFCPRCAGAIKGPSALAVVPLCKCPPPCDHTTVDHDERGPKNAAGRFTVTERCACGRVIGTYEDGVL